MKIGHNKILFITIATAASLLSLLVQESAEITDEKDSEIVYPEIIRKQKRSFAETIDSTGHENDIFVRFNAFGSEFRSKLSRRDLIATNAASFTIGSNGDILNAEDLTGRYYNGKINGDADSFVSLSYSNGLEGFLRTKNTNFKIQPLMNEKSNDSTVLPHLVTRSIIPQNETFGIHFPEREQNEHHHTRAKRGGDDKTREKTVETLLVLDQKMTQYYGLDVSKQYALTVANIAHEILRDQSIGQNPIKFTIVKILLLVTPQENLVINHHAQNTLKSFGQWASLQASKYEVNGDQFDYAILLTRYNICKDKEQPCDNSGVSNIGGMCGFPASVAVIKDQGLLTGYFIAHHAGHSLGMYHDGDGNSCDGRNKVMSPAAGYGEGAFSWSSCSAAYLEQFLRSPKSKCLDDTPSKVKRRSNALYSNPGVVFDVTSQCQLVGGDGAKACYFGDDMELCIELQCLMPNQSSCFRTGKPPADGTACGKTKWCKHGMCVEKHFPDVSYVDGGWTSWGEFGPCSRSCGGGITYRERSCQNPKPFHGGKYCEGDSRDYQVCNKKACPEFASGFRVIQCNRKAGFFLGDVKYSWTYVTSRSDAVEESCNLRCIAKNDAEISQNFGRALDGTDCYLFNLNLPGKCVAGECISVGCDLVLESRERLDRCGICRGDGSSCRKAPNQPVKGPPVFVNATGKLQTAIKKLQVSRNATEVLNKTDSTIGNGTPLKFDTKNKTRIVQDQSLQQNTTKHDTGMYHLFRALKKLKALRSLMKAVLSKKCNADIKCLQKYNYFDLKHKKSEVALPTTFQWVMTSSGCNVPCGIGTEYLYPECHRQDDGSSVGRKFCSMLPEPPERSKACRLPSCTARWATSDWEPCSKTCGGGLQSRNVFCIKTIDEDFVVPDVLCNAGEKPSLKQICNKQECTAMWISEPFGKCSTSCGKGIQIREVYCKVKSPSRGMVIVDDIQCNAAERPERELLCNVHNPCPGDGKCGGNFTKLSGIISSPNFPNPYQNNKECLSEITVPVGMLVNIAFIELAINGSKKSESSCEGDFLRIAFGGCSELSGKPYSLYCGDEIPQSIMTSISNKICIKFFSDDSGTDKGFSLKYTALKDPKEPLKIIDICDVHAKNINSSYGAVMSPNYPDVYPMNEYCKLTISSTDKSGFIISFKDFNIGTTGPSKLCDNDYLEIHHNGFPEKVCGAQRTKKATINGDSFTLVFHSGNMKLGGTGFIMTYITKNVMKAQLMKINKKKHEMATNTLQRNMVPPQYKDASTAHFRPVKNPDLLLTEALTSLKKKDIIHPMSGYDHPQMMKNETSRPSLKSVLDLLAGGQNIPAKANVLVSSRLQNNRPIEYEDYTKAGIYKKESIAVSNPSHTGFAGKGQNIQRVVVPFGGTPQQKQRGFETSKSTDAVIKSMTNKELWDEYWKLYSQYHTNNRGQTLSSQNSHPNVLTPRGYINSGQNSGSNGQVQTRIKSSYVCPTPAALQCPVAAILPKCRVDTQCAFAPTVQCCPSLCPYAPYVCAWTR